MVSAFTEQLLKDLFGFDNVEVSDLHGYANKNYLVKSGGEQFILKTYSDVSMLDALQGETSILLWLQNSGSNVPLPVAGLDGQYVYRSESLLVRLLSYQHGSFLGDLDIGKGILESFGGALGRMDHSLSDFRNPEIESRRITWDLAHLGKAYDNLPYIKDPSRRALVQYFYQQYELIVRPVWHRLPMQIIHNDANEWNVLVDGDEVGFIDFGDSVYTARICEVAIAITYAVMGQSDPLEKACLLLRAYVHELPLEESEIELLYYLVAGRLIQSILHAALGQEMEPENEYLQISQQPAWVLLEKWVMINPARAERRFKEVSGIDQSLDNSDLLVKRSKYFSAAMSLSYKRPIRMSRAAFQYMYDTEGNTFLDAYNNIPHVGHEHPRVVEAGIRQMSRLNTNTRYLYDSLTDYAEKLLEKFPSPLSKVFFVNSGSAATDLALRMAKVHSGKDGVAVMQHGYHGNTARGIGVSHYKYAHKGGSGNPGNLELPMPDFVRGVYKDRTTEDYILEAVSALKNSDLDMGAFIAEPIIGCGGQIELPAGFLPAVYPAVRERGGICISDEVQVGFGRVGSSFWGFELYNVVPDVVILGKPMANGHPMGAVVTTDEIADSFDNGMEFFSSFGGNPVSCEIAAAVLNVLEEEGLQANALETGNYFKQKLDALKNHFPETIIDVRGQGLFLGVELTERTGDPGTSIAAFLKNEMRERNILVSTDGPFDNVIKMKPPLCFTKLNVDTVVQNMSDILENFH